jgi:signal transduction histidine kinase
MHDIVAHSPSVVVVQADGAAYAAEHTPTGTPSQASATLHTTGATAREALDETHRLV